MIEKLKKEVYNANLELYKKNVVIYTWGNVSCVSRDDSLVIIKPSGVPYDELTPEKMVVVDFDMNIIEGNLKPSSDTATHIELYKAFKKIGGVVHTHSVNATSFADAGINIPALGTTHADYFYGEVPCTREFSKDEVDTDYEKNTGKVIVDTFRNIDYNAVPAVLVKNHGPFTWGKDPFEAVYHAVVLEIVANMALKTLQINANATMQRYILDKHYLRKHGANATYGQ